MPSHGFRVRADHALGACHTRSRRLQRLQDPAAVAGARKALQSAVAAAKQDDQPVLCAALVVLGARDQALAASRGLAGGDKEVIVRALGLAGCTDMEIEQAASHAYTVKNTDTGTLCTH